jgi:hypothetical protein
MLTAPRGLGTVCEQRPSADHAFAATNLPRSLHRKVRTKEQSKRRACNLIPIMVLNDRPTCKDRRAAELILARSTRLHQRPNTLPQTCLLAQTNPCSRAADHTLARVIASEFDSR